MAKRRRNYLLDAINEAANINVYARPSGPVNNTDIAQLITAFANGDTSVGPSMAAKQGAESEGPSLISKIFDTLDTPRQVVAGIIEDAKDEIQHQKGSNNLFEDILHPIAAAGESFTKNITGGAGRSVGNLADIIGQVTGLDKMPIVGKVQHGIEEGGQGLGDKLLPRHFGHEDLAAMGVKNKPAQFGGGFAIDILEDPLTYLTFGGSAAARVATRGAESAAEKLTAKAATNVPEITGRNLFKEPPIQVTSRPVAEQAVGRNLIPQPTAFAGTTAKAPISGNPGLLQSILGNATEHPENLAELQALRRTDNAKRAAEVRWGRDPDKLDVADVDANFRAAFVDNMRDAKLAKAGKVSDGKGNISTRGVQRVFDDISSGTVPRFGPLPAAAVGEHAELAKQVADDLAKNLTKSSRKGRTATELTPADQANLYTRVHNAAAELVNTRYLEKPVKALSEKQQSITDNLKAWVVSEEQAGRQVDKARLQKELDAMHAKKTINKTDAKAILRDFYPPAKAANYAATRYGAAQVSVLARQMLKSAEDHLLSKGIQPVYWNGMRMRLSDVMEEIGPEANRGLLTQVMDAVKNSNPKAVTDPVAREAIQRALARRSLSMSDLLGRLSEHTIEAKRAVQSDWKLPKPLEDKILNGLPDAAADSVAARGATLAESVASREYIRGIVDADKIPLDKFYETVGDTLARTVMEGKALDSQIHHVNKLMNETLHEIPLTQRATNGFMIRFSTYYGRQAEMKRYMGDVFGFAEENALYRGRFLRGLARDFVPEDLRKGLLLAQKPELVAGEVSEQVLKAHQIFKNYFDWMLGSTGFDKLSDLNGTVAVRSSMIMTDVNKHLKAIGSKFYFVDKKVPTTLDGTTKDYSAKGLGWMRSWENASPENPTSLLHDIDLALQRTVAEYNTYDEFASIFGKAAKGGNYTVTIPHPRLKGYYFDPEHAQGFLKLMGDMEKGRWTPKSQAMRTAMNATRAWKSSVTIYYPVHHIRNLIGDSFNTWLAGHNNPTIYSRAIKVLESQKSRYGEALKLHDQEMLRDLIDKDRLLFAETRVAKDTDTVISAKRGTKITAEQLWASGFRRGLFRDYNKTEDLFGDTPMGALMKTSPENSTMRFLTAPFGGRAHRVAAQISEHREHYVRMAHYIGAVEKRIKKGETDLTKIFDDAAHEVKKWHPDGTDLTEFEQKLRVAIPFYAWTRKEIPLLAQTMVQKPAKLVAYPRIQEAVAGASGIPVNDEQGLLDPYPDNQLFPNWIRATGIGPIGDPQSDSPVARFWAKFAATTESPFGTQGYSMINPSNPFNDVTTQLFGFGDPKDSLRAFGNSLNPGLGVPMDLLTNTTFSGAPITGEGGKGYADYFGSQIPQIGTFDRLFGGPNKDTTHGQNQQALLNFLTALGIRGTGPYQKSAEFEAKERLK